MKCKIFRVLPIKFYGALRVVTGEFFPQDNALATKQTKQKKNYTTQVSSRFGLFLAIIKFFLFSFSSSFSILFYLILFYLIFFL